MSLSRSAIAYGGLAVLSVIWGLAFVAIRQVELELSPVNLALSRWLITDAIFVVLIPVIGKLKTKFERKDVLRLLVVGFANVAGYHLFLNYAETTISAGLSSVIIALGPVFMVVLSVFLLNERASSKVVLSLLLAVVGIVVLSSGTFSLSDLSSLAGIVSAVLAAFCYALFTVLGKPLVQKYGSAPTTIYAGLVGTVMLLPLLSTSFFAQVGALNWVGWTSVLYLGALSSAFGYLLFYTLLSRKAVASLSIQLYLIPVVGVVGGWVLLSEPVTLTTVVGGAMVLAAVAFATRK
jgi:drug/metabolite transporter (DMT)-like permease